MEYAEYVQRYEDYMIALHQSSVISKVSMHVLDDFPKNLPDALAQPYNTLMVSLLQQVSELGRDHTDLPLQIELVGLAKEFVDFVMLVVTHLNAGRDDPIDFYVTITSQQLVMIFAHLDAFMADSLRVICGVEPRIMKSNKEKTWDSILAAENWDNLLKKMIDEFVADFVRPSVTKRIDFLVQRLKIPLNIPQEEKVLLDEAEQLRHAYVHNGGRVDSRLMNVLKRDAVNLGLNTRRRLPDTVAAGSQIRLDSNYLEAVNRAALNLGTQIFGEVCRKFYAGKVPIDRFPSVTTGTGEIVVVDDNGNID